MGQLITCTRAGTSTLTRGRQYELLALTPEKQFVRVRADKGRTDWYRAEFFDLSGGPVPVLVAWRFDEPVVELLSGLDETCNWVDIRLQFNDGTERWSQLITPDYLKRTVESPSMPVFYAKQLIVVRDLLEETVEQVLVYLDEEGELLDYSTPLETTEDGDTDNDEPLE